MLLRQALRGAAEIELDDFGGARADEEEQLDVGTARQQLIDDAVELLVAIGHPGEVAFLDDGGAETRFGEDHHAGGGLEEVRAGAAADDEEESVLNFAVEPDNPGQPAENFALAAFTQDRRTVGSRGRHDAAHAVTIFDELCSRAARSFRRNCPALMT